MSRVFMKGCEAIAEAAVRSGCRFFAGYPITPQNEIPEYFARRLPEVGGNFVQDSYGLCKHFKRGSGCRFYSACPDGLLSGDKGFRKRRI